MVDLEYAVEHQFRDSLVTSSREHRLNISRQCSWIAESEIEKGGVSTDRFDAQARLPLGTENAIKIWIVLEVGEEGLLFRRKPIKEHEVILRIGSKGSSGYISQ
jgi:hypothetical protein